MQESSKERLAIGIDVVEADASVLKGMGRIGIVTNQTCCSSLGNPTPNVIYMASKGLEGCEVVSVFGPQHGFYQTEQDNMKETPDLDILLEDSDGSNKRVPLYSLYSTTREPTPDQMAAIDTLIVDLPDIGCRIYTYMITLAACLRAAKEHGKKVVVLDRPNPLGLSYKDGDTWKRVEGNVLDLKYRSFVGWFKIPLRHGLTMGELGHLFIKQENLHPVDYSVIKVKGLTRKTDPLTLLGAEGGFSMSLNFPFASPNMPSLLSALFFPSFVVLEATNVSEGRGTTLPFQVVGAPYLDTGKCKEYLRQKQKTNRDAIHNSLNGITFTEHHFRPTFNKHMGQICKGIHFRYNNAMLQSTVVEPNFFALGVYYLFFCVKEHHQQFKWREPKEGYEYNFEDPPLLLIYGSERWWKCLEEYRQRLINNMGKVEGDQEEDGADDYMEECLLWAHGEAQQFAQDTAPIHLY